MRGQTSSRVWVWQGREWLEEFGRVHTPAFGSSGLMQKCIAQTGVFRHSWDVRHKHAILVLWFVSVVFTSCAGRKTLRPDELRSDLGAAVSLAAETQLFIAQMENDHGTRAFAVGHLGYLRDEALRSAKELREAQSDPAIAPRVGICAAQMNSLALEITVLQGEARTQFRSLSASKARIEEIRAVLIKWETGL
jgi:hypothetical protein